MVAVFLERIGLALIALVIIAVVVFFALELMPGDACTVHLGRGVTGQHARGLPHADGP
jgi:ABC-type dipeptide/oligopeptide/nickel transport system permease component